MYRLFSLLALALICTAATDGPQGRSEASGGNWYGSAIGDQVPTGRTGPEDFVWPGGPPAPWTEGTITTDDDHRISEIFLTDAPPILIGLPYRPGSISPPTPPSVTHSYYEAGIAARAYAIARLGPPREIKETRYEGDLKWASLRWDFVETFVKCESGMPVYDSLFTEPTGLIAEATLDYAPDGVTLDIKGKNASYSRKQLLEQSNELCKPKPPEEDVVGKIGEGIREMCSTNPGRCISPVPGLTVMPAPGVDARQRLRPLMEEGFNVGW